jgi:hypothetical protein
VVVSQAPYPRTSLSFSEEYTAWTRRCGTSAFTQVIVFEVLGPLLGDLRGKALVGELIRPEAL